jgi:hypothetical protein
MSFPVASFGAYHKEYDGDGLTHGEYIEERAYLHNPSHWPLRSNEL